jgi:hypothetical protein
VNVGIQGAAFSTASAIGDGGGLPAAQAVPEPATTLGLGIVALATLRRRRLRV